MLPVLNLHPVYNGRSAANLEDAPRFNARAQALRSAGVKLIVEPYEADAQLAYLSRSGAVDVVITEDSDCLPYGCKKVVVMVLAVGPMGITVCS